MAIPFNTLSKPETVNVAGISVPKRGCLTVAEEIATRDLGATIEQETEGMTELQKDLRLKLKIVTILFQSRFDKEWTLEKTQAPRWEVVIDGQNQLIEPDMVILDELFTFFINEQRRWKTVAELEAIAKGSEGKPKKN